MQRYPNRILLNNATTKRFNCAREGKLNSMKCNATSRVARKTRKLTIENKSYTCAAQLVPHYTFVTTNRPKLSWQTAILYWNNNTTVINTSEMFGLVITGIIS